MTEIIYQPPAHMAPARRIPCDLSWAPIGKPCTVSGPQGDHLARLVTAVKLGLLTKAELAEVVRGVVGSLRDRFGGQLQILVEIHEPGHVALLSSGALIDLRVARLVVGGAYR